MSDFIKTYAILFHKSYTAVAGLKTVLQYSINPILDEMGITFVRCFSANLQKGHPNTNWNIWLFLISPPYEDSILYNSTHWNVVMMVGFNQSSLWDKRPNNDLLLHHYWVSGHYVGIFGFPHTIETVLERNLQSKSIQDPNFWNTAIQYHLQLELPWWLYELLNDPGNSIGINECSCPKVFLLLW